ncbi:GNAT family N-acetyltransferase [Spirochaeta cellobiosiphila]|uniref:GNAT family N-acetyltransferase n=1 Tax=Spirochaeta cellobiosiphila TaxID=504483 RepID=UPI00041A86B8|nr:GNAT family N-acetyltransferase [Spirochaeta cellobiosiphila]
MKLELIPAPHDEIIQNLFPYYVYDMSEYAGFSPDEKGSFAVAKEVSRLDEYWTKEKHYPYHIMVDGEIAGFVLIRPYPDREEYNDIGQFFVLRKFKHKGVGREAFIQVVHKHPGKWITRVLPNNKGAYEFWTKVITQETQGSYSIKREVYGDKPMDFIYYHTES